MILKTAATLLGAIATWTAVTVATAPAAEPAPQPAITVAQADPCQASTMMFNPCAVLDPSHVDYRDAKGTVWSWVSPEAGYEPAGAN